MDGGPALPRPAISMSRVLITTRPEGSVAVARREHAPPRRRRGQCGCRGRRRCGLVSPSPAAGAAVPCVGPALCSNANSSSCVKGAIRTHREKSKETNGSAVFAGCGRDAHLANSLCKPLNHNTPTARHLAAFYLAIRWSVPIAPDLSPPNQRPSTPGRDREQGDEFRRDLGTNWPPDRGVRPVKSITAAAPERRSYGTAVDGRDAAGDRRRAPRKAVLRSTTAGRDRGRSRDQHDRPRSTERAG